MTLIEQLYRLYCRYGRGWLKLGRYAEKHMQDRGDGFRMTRNKAYRKKLRQLEQRLITASKEKANG